MQQHFIQGQKLRQRYMIETPFLNKKYHASEIYVKSGDSDRSLSSALANLAGMYQSSPDTEPDFAGWPTGWTPIPVHTQASSTDFVGFFSKAEGFGRGGGLSGF